MVVGLLFEGGGLFGIAFLVLGIIAYIAERPWIFFAPFIGLFGILILLNAMFNKNFWE